MSPSTSLRLFQALRPSLISSCRSHTPISSTITRPFSQAPTLLASKPPQQNQPLADPLDFNQRSANIERSRKPQPQSPSSSAFGSLIPTRDPSDPLSNLQNLSTSDILVPSNHHLHIYAHKHNTHITLTTPDMDPLISVSCGNIGFRKAGRGSYDAAYQLAAFVMSRIQDKGLLPQIQRLEVIYRGFGAGREAVTKAILGSEGRRIRGLVVRLSDSTRLKFGGTRSKKPRRLG